MRRRTVRAATRVALFTVMCLVSMFVLVTVFGQFRFDSRASYSAVFTNVSGLKGGNFVRIAGVEVGKVKDLTLHKDGTVTVDFFIDKGLTERKPDIATGTASINAAAGSVADLLPAARQPIKDTVRQTDRFAGQIMADHGYVDDLVRPLPDAYQVLARNGLYGDYFGFYLSDPILKANGKGGQPG